MWRRLNERNEKMTHHLLITPLVDPLLLIVFAHSSANLIGTNTTTRVDSTSSPLHPSELAASSSETQQEAYTHTMYRMTSASQEKGLISQKRGTHIDGTHRIYSWPTKGLMESGCPSFCGASLKSPFHFDLSVGN
ncbi:hypothetical protein TNCV_4643181 [Trichonephila clavipes]|nr:hypothetical protein TNCV_4643181 [Trichonephila clavipes]